MGSKSKKVQVVPVLEATVEPVVPEVAMEVEVAITTEPIVKVKKGRARNAKKARMAAAKVESEIKKAAEKLDLNVAVEVAVKTVIAVEKVEAITDSSKKDTAVVVKKAKKVKAKVSKKTAA